MAVSGVVVVVVVIVIGSDGGSGMSAVAGVEVAAGNGDRLGGCRCGRELWETS